MVVQMTSHLVVGLNNRDKLTRTSNNKWLWERKPGTFVGMGKKEDIQ